MKKKSSLIREELKSKSKELNETKINAMQYQKDLKKVSREMSETKTLLGKCFVDLLDVVSFLRLWHPSLTSMGTWSLNTHILVRVQRATIDFLM